MNSTLQALLRQNFLSFAHKGILDLEGRKLAQDHNGRRPSGDRAETRMKRAAGFGDCPVTAPFTDNREQGKTAMLSDLEAIKAIDRLSFTWSRHPDVIALRPWIAAHCGLNPHAAGPLDPPSIGMFWFSVTAVFAGDRPRSGPPRPKSPGARTSKD